MQRFLALGFSIVIAALGHPAAQDPVSVVGSTSARPVVEQVIRQFRPLHPGIAITLTGGGSAAGLREVGKGDAAIGMVSRDLTAAELEEYPDLIAHEIGVDGLAILVNKSNPIANLTTAQLRDLFVGRYRNWSELGGPDQAVEVLFQAPTHGTFDAFVDLLGLEATVRRDGKVGVRIKGQSDWFEVKTVDGAMSGLGAAVAGPGVVTFASLGVVSLPQRRGAAIRMVRIDGIAPSKQNLADGTYKLRRSLILVTKGQPTGAVREFIEYAQSPEGQKIIGGLDVLPATPK